MNTMPSELLPSAFSEVVTPPRSVQRRKGKQMIVDISINDQGEQVYQVHGTRSSTRRKLEGSSLDDERPSKRMTPIRSILGTISPSTLNQDKRSVDLNKRSNLTGSPSTRKADEANIWSDDVESAFEEALKMIPKNGLTKIKVSGKSCGRNELISDYILQKTGKLRTRKQVSSHIQVIKNLKKKLDLIELINNGPSNPDDIKKFEQVFTEIFFQKSMGSSNGGNVQEASSSEISTPKRSSPRRSTPRQSCSKRSPKKATRSLKKPQKPSRIPLNYEPVLCSLKHFEMIHADLVQPVNTHIYTRLSPSHGQALRLKPDASVQTRFPNLTEYFQSDLKPEQQIPIIHNLVNLALPSHDQKLEGSHETELDLELKNVSFDKTEFGCLTTIYSFGNEVIELSEDVDAFLKSPSRTSENNYLLKVPFAREFWVAFLSSIENNVNNLGDPIKANNQKNIAIKAVTMKQVIYHKKSENGFQKGDIKTVILWEFTRAVETCETTSRRLYLPNKCTQTELPLLPKLSEPIEQPPTQHLDQPQSQRQAHPHHSHQPVLHVKCEVPLQVPPAHPQYVPHMITPTLEDDETSSATSTLQFDEMERHNMAPMNQHQQQFRNNSFPLYLPEDEQQPQSFQARRMMSEPTAWAGQHNTQLHVQGSMNDGFNTDEFQGFHTYTSDTTPMSMLDPGYILLDQHPEHTSGEVFNHW